MLTRFQKSVLRALVAVSGQAFRGALLVGRQLPLPLPGLGLPKYERKLVRRSAQRPTAHRSPMPRRKRLKAIRAHGGKRGSAGMRAKLRRAQ